MSTQVPTDLTPLMRQYYAIKQQYPHALLFFQVGDFYELFFDDAKNASAYLGIALTKRGKVNGDPIPLCGVPVHALNHYLAKLIKGGFKVALCDQLEEAKPGKMVERGVTQVFTPGTLTDSKLLDEKSASYILSFNLNQTEFGLVFAELLTAQLYATAIPAHLQKALEAELIRFFPDEIIVPDEKHIKPFQAVFNKLGYCTSIISDENALANSQEWLSQNFQDHHAAFGAHDSIKSALSYFYSYMRQTQQLAIDQFKTINWYAPEDFLILDPATQTNLELIKNTHDGSRKNTLFEIVDGALTPMGSRMIKKWIMRPLVKQQAITQRLDVVQQLLSNVVICKQLEQLLSELGDIERVIGRIALRRGSVHDFCHLKRVLGLLPQLYACIVQLEPTLLLRAVAGNFSDFNALYQLLQAALVDDFAKDWIIKQGFDQELDHLRDIMQNASQKVMALELQEQTATGINSLKIRYNQVHGYYIEVTKTHTDSIPSHYIRQQTLVGRERYITPELQQLQHEILHAQMQTAQVEKAAFERIKQEVHGYLGLLRKLAHALANLDALIGLARVSYEKSYVRPQFNENRKLEIMGGRHPVVERVIGHHFIPNDTLLTQDQATWIITGPNMGGKSTYLRQVALVSIMAQLGCYIPAKAANLAILDRIFTRIGAGDNLAQGKSTFLVEMEETAAICSQATENSLVILDEVGRGTSTFDGLAIAQAVVEYIHTAVKARCLFATHYQELTLLPHNFKGIVSYYAASRKTERGIQFMYKIMPGVADGSFGVEVAKLAELPNPVIERAQALLEDLQHHSSQISYRAAEIDKDGYAINLKKQFEVLREQLDHAQARLATLDHIDYDNLSPKQAFDILWKMKG
ncbi:MAG: DNA mismatch repair protein MutS [Candidatus Babeliales bacterium]